MEFGKLENIEKVDWSFPQDDFKNYQRLQSQLNRDQFMLYFGTPAWGVPHWPGRIYPLKTPLDQYLYYYSRYFHCIELNSSHYAIPDVKTIQKWLSLSSPSFQFCPKVYKGISHTRSGLFDKKLLSSWFCFLEQISAHLGPCFIQFHEHFSYQDKRYLFYFLEHWPKDFRLSIELRHESWFRDGVVLPALTDYLYERGIGLVITDVSGRRDVLHSSLSTNWAIVRLKGNHLHESDQKRLKDWAYRIKLWKEQGLKEVFFFLHQTGDLTTLEFAELAQEMFFQFGSMPESYRPIRTQNLYENSFQEQLLPF